MAYIHMHVICICTPFGKACTPANTHTHTQMSDGVGVGLTVSVRQASHVASVLEAVHAARFVTAQKTKSARHRAPHESAPQCNDCLR